MVRRDHVARLAGLDMLAGLDEQPAVRIVAFAVLERTSLALQFDQVIDPAER